MQEIFFFDFERLFFFSLRGFLSLFYKIVGANDDLVFVIKPRYPVGTSPYFKLPDPFSDGVAGFGENARVFTRLLYDAENPVPFRRFFLVLRHPIIGKEVCAVHLATRSFYGVYGKNLLGYKL
ncbi:MAG TPA: hypothetical protein PLA80_13495 [Synergistaceae bacterium]|nr:hypothetical protein [Synergistaceae bacterium]